MAVWYSIVSVSLRKNLKSSQTVHMSLNDEHYVAHKEIVFPFSFSKSASWPEDGYLLPGGLRTPRTEPGTARWVNTGRLNAWTNKHTPPASHPWTPGKHPNVPQHFLSEAVKYKLSVVQRVTPPAWFIRRKINLSALGGNSLHVIIQQWKIF